MIVSQIIFYNRLLYLLYYILCQWIVFSTYPLGEVISLVVLPHALHHQLHCVWVGGFAMEVHPHEGGHSGQQAGDLLQLLTGSLHVVRPGVIHQEDTAGSTGGV